MAAFPGAERLGWLHDDNRALPRAARPARHTGNPRSNAALLFLVVQPRKFYFGSEHSLEREKEQLKPWVLGIKI